MEETNLKEETNKYFSRAIKAGKRTYFFDVKETANQQLYITITESKRKVDKKTGSPIYEKHKIHLYMEDFEKFANGLSDAIESIATAESPLISDEIPFKEEHVNISFEDLTINY